MQLERPVWRISDRFCARSDHERHLAHIVKVGDRWFAFDATHSSSEGNEFLFLGSFARRETAMDAVEDGARLVKVTLASRRERATPKVLHSRTHLPLYSLAAAAGMFGEQQTEVNPEGWVEVPPSPIRITRDMFVTHIEGRSMEPTIPNGSLCAFRSNVSAPYEGKIFLMEDYSEVGGNRYAVKRYRTSINADPNKEGDLAWLHERITLESINPDYAPWEVTSARKVNVIGEFVFTIPYSDNRSRPTAGL
jgi:SOS-response transcriptional repressor LexA